MHSHERKAQQFLKRLEVNLLLSSAELNSEGGVACEVLIRIAPGTSSESGDSAGWLPE